MVRSKGRQHAVHKAAVEVMRADLFNREDWPSSATRRLGGVRKSKESTRTSFEMYRFLPIMKDSSGHRQPA
jgi:hypothetical protein